MAGKKGPGLRTLLLFVLFLAVVGYQQLIVSPRATSDGMISADWGSSASIN